MGVGGIAICILNLCIVFGWLVVFTPWQLLVGKVPPVKKKKVKISLLQAVEAPRFARGQCSHII
jgi:hypothetical protein